MRISLRAVVMSVATTCLFAAGTASAAGSTVSAQAMGSTKQEAVLHVTNALAAQCESRGESAGPLTNVIVEWDPCGVFLYAEGRMNCQAR